MKEKKLLKNFLALVNEKYERGTSKAMTRVIWEALEPYSDEQAVDAFGWVVKHGRFSKDILPDLMDQLEKEEERAEVPLIQAPRHCLECGESGLIDLGTGLCRVCYKKGTSSRVRDLVDKAFKK